MLQLLHVSGIKTEDGITRANGDAACLDGIKTGDGIPGADVIQHMEMALGITAYCMV